MRCRADAITLLSTLCLFGAAHLVNVAKADEGGDHYVFDVILCHAEADTGGTANCSGPNGTIVRWDVPGDGCSYHQTWVGFDRCPEIEHNSSAFLACKYERANAT